jgi:lipopolysaccharide biosynthesis protein
MTENRGFKNDSGLWRDGSMYSEVNEIDLRTASGSSTGDRHVRHVIAHYLPQFHVIAENEEWYGSGFTEWTNVRKSRPLTLGHRPVRPGALGWYSLDSTDAIYQQASLAERFGVTSFALWHYWFGGRLVLEKPAQNLLGDPSLPAKFCFFWANETWKGSWYGAPNRVLISQDYPEGDAAKHFEYLAPFLADPRYTRINGRPLIGLYRPSQIPQIDRYLDTWRSRAHQLGLADPYIIGQDDTDLDAPASCEAIWSNPLRFSPGAALVPRRISHALRQPWAIDARKLERALTAHHDQATGRTVPTVMPNWDNTPRSFRRGSYLVRNSSEVFAKQVEGALRLDNKRRAAGLDSIVLVKSWNEWAEGNVLEPSEEFDHQFGDALATSLKQLPAVRIPGQVIANVSDSIGASPTSAHRQ